MLLYKYPPLRNPSQFLNSYIDGANAEGLTFVHHRDMDIFGDVGVVLMALEGECAVDPAHVFAPVIVGDVGDDDGHVLQVLRVGAPVPLQPPDKAFVQDLLVRPLIDQDLQSRH